MNKHELKSLLENIYEAMILPTLGQELYANPSLLTPPYKPPVAPPTGIHPNGMSPFLPPMPLDPNGHPLFPSLKFWSEYYQAMRAIPSGATMITHPTEMEEFQRLSRQLQEWQQQQQQQRPDDGGPLG